MTAYYNEIDPYAAQWLRNLIAAGHIAPGVVDERSITDVQPSDLTEFVQCHFFAGIGVWSHALRTRGWDDARPVWTGSCPCQPFSAAGKQTGTDDERHLWPTWFKLIEKRKPAVVFGEQVEAAIKHGWLDLVQADLEGIGYAFAAAGIPAAGVGAPHIRQRLYFVADTESYGYQRAGGFCESYGRDGAAYGGATGRLGNNNNNTGLEGLRSGHQAESGRDGAVRPVAEAGEFGGVDDTDGGSTGNTIPTRGQLHDRSSELGGLADEELQQRSTGQPGFGYEHDARRRIEGSAAPSGLCSDHRPGPTNGHWRDADWLYCRDGKWRPVESRPQPMVDGSAESLGRVCTGTIRQIEEEINASAMESEIRRPEVLRALQEHLGAEAKQVWSTGRFPGLSEAPFLLAFLRQLKAEGWGIQKDKALLRPQTAPSELRVLRFDAQTTSTPYQHGLDRQPTGEYSNAVHFLSSLLARHAQAEWASAYRTYAEIGFPLHHGARSRVGRLRAYGNAIVSQVAQEMIAAYMSVRP